MTEARAEEIEVVDVDERPGRHGGVELTYRLSSEPDKAWAKAFDTTSVNYSGPGTVNFLGIARPYVEGTTVRWTVPKDQTERARGYVQQRIDHANAAAAESQIR